MLFSAGSIAPCCWRTRRATRAGPAALRQRRLGVGREERAMLRATAARPRPSPAVSPLRRARVRHARRLPADALGGPRDAAGVRHAGRRRLPRRTQCRAAVEGGRLHGAAPGEAGAVTLLGPLAGNPFPDATPAFFAAIAQALSLGLGRRSRSRRRSRRAQGGRDSRGRALGVPLELTLSCMNPKAARHCGAAASAASGAMRSGVAGSCDPTRYAVAPVSVGNAEPVRTAAAGSAVAGADAERAAAVAELPLERARARSPSRRATPSNRVESLRMPPSPVWASSSAPKPDGRYSVTPPSPVVIPVLRHRRARSRAVGDRSVAGVHLHDVELARDVDAAVAGVDVETCPGLSTVTDPSPVSRISSPLTSDARMLPSPVRSSSRP